MATPKTLDNAISHARAEEDILKMLGTINKDATWQLRVAVEDIAKEMEKNNWQPCIYGVRPMRCGEREEIIDPNYKTPSPFVKVTKTSDWPKKPTWTSVAVRTFWITLKSFLMAYGAFWAIFFIIKAVG